MEIVIIGLALTSIIVPTYGYGAADIAFAALILTVAGQRGKIAHLLTKGPMAWLGVLSYSIYMVHGLVIFTIFQIARFFDLTRLANIRGTETRILDVAPLAAGLAGLGILATTVAVSWFSWRYIEAPARNWSRRLADRIGVGKDENSAPTF